MASTLIAPPPVRAGSAVAVVSPSAPAAGLYPARVERARAYLESLGLRMRLMPNSTGVEGWVSASAEARAADIHEAFLDDEVTVVLAAIGGNHSNALLPHLDHDLIRSHPKIFQGYSDITVLHWAFLRHAGLRTFYGPALVPELGEYPRPLPYTDRFLRAAWFGEAPIGFEPAEEWTEEFLDWELEPNVVRPRRLLRSSGWLALRDGSAEGPLLGGCLETILWHLKGSAAWLELEGAILFLETSEEAPPPSDVDAYLTDLEQLGVFESITGLVVGRPMRYPPEATETLWRVVSERTETAGIPVLANVDLGHTDPMLTMPLGAQARFDAGAGRLELLESPTA